MKKYRISLNGKTYEVEVEEINEVNDTKDKIEKVTPITQQKKSSDRGESVKAPMPGTIVSVNVNEGDNVQAGEVLLILEAMKMENEIVAPINGKISSINISQGASVAAGDVLITIA
ncbi:acetyl-CoA carboxylase biotin carboxyl carrier protein subunit [Tepidibacter thalassicus]|uniref:Biotin-requiring enzyme n=1 Tax=Tepidibacter thalassicus DSM 15285 TaxID=1123350 RepID=A0A1M5TIK5_9FIRM|nr:acetyl-CoA carboxylase biotin carboxyl carrier protein subunit [Tepidibacter thalassicus]SHH50592.1 Biotin-requiring enzyme [Tepidibacter thalassicus DSM 15285]